MPTAENDFDLGSVPGVGSKTAENLRDEFGTDFDALNAAYSIPEWVRANVDGIGEKNLQNLRESAEQTIDSLGDSPYSSPAGDRKKASVLSGDRREIYEKYYYPVGFTDENIALWYSGYYQGGAYKTRITRQVWDRDKVNAVTWGYWHEADGAWKLFRNHKYRIDQYTSSSPVDHPSGAEYLADIVDDHDWTHLTEAGLIYYQRGRNYALADYPESLDGATVIGRNLYDPVEYSLSGGLVGITLDRIAVYWCSGRREGAVPLVKTPDGRLYRLAGEAGEFQTNARDFFDGYNSPEGLVADLANASRRGMGGCQKGGAEGGLWKDNLDGGVQVFSTFESSL